MARHGSATARVEGDPILPLNVYGPEVSYFTGKLEAVLRFMGLPYRPIAKGPVQMAGPTGVAQVPGLELADGRWLTDTTPIIAWLDERYPDRGVIPRDPAAAFMSRLLEDYADEWLWRPAMHYRWDYPEGAHHVSRVLVDEAARHVPLPGFVKRHLIRSRQRTLFTKGDGVTPETWDHVEKIYLDSLAQLGAIFETRPYVLGTRPSLADFGFFGPMFRHFSMDPPSARIMRETAPGVFEWVARVWNARASVTGGELLEHVPDDWGPILDSIGTAYLPYLCANAEAWKAGQSHFVSRARPTGESARRAIASGASRSCGATSTSYPNRTSTRSAPDWNRTDVGSRCGASKTRHRVWTRSARRRSRAATR
jgi:glutathione S-transferase